MTSTGRTLMASVRSLKADTTGRHEAVRGPVAKEFRGNVRTNRRTAEWGAIVHRQRWRTISSEEGYDGPRVYKSGGGMAINWSTCANTIARRTAVTRRLV